MEESQKMNGFISKNIGKTEVTVIFDDEIMKLDFENPVLASSLKFRLKSTPKIDGGLSFSISMNQHFNKKFDISVQKLPTEAKEPEVLKKLAENRSSVFRRSVPSLKKSMENSQTNFQQDIKEKTPSISQLFGKKNVLKNYLKANRIKLEPVFNKPLEVNPSALEDCSKNSQNLETEDKTHGTTTFRSITHLEPLNLDEKSKGTGKDEMICTLTSLKSVSQMSETNKGKARSSSKFLIKRKSSASKVVIPQANSASILALHLAKKKGTFNKL